MGKKKKAAADGSRMEFEVFQSVCGYRIGRRIRKSVASSLLKVYVLKSAVGELEGVGCERLVLWNMSTRDMEELKQQVKQETIHKKRENIMPLVMQMTKDQIETAYQPIIENWNASDTAYNERDADEREQENNVADIKPNRKKKLARKEEVIKPNRKKKLVKNEEVIKPIQKKKLVRKEKVIKPVHKKKLDMKEEVIKPIQKKKLVRKKKVNPRSNTSPECSDSNLSAPVFNKVKSSESLNIGCDAPLDEDIRIRERLSSVDSIASQASSCSTICTSDVLPWTKHDQCVDGLKVGDNLATLSANVNINLTEIEKSVLPVIERDFHEEKLQISNSGKEFDADLGITGCKELHLNVPCDHQQTDDVQSMVSCDLSGFRIDTTTDISMNTDCDADNLKNSGKVQDKNSQIKPLEKESSTTVVAKSRKKKKVPTATLR